MEWNDFPDVLWSEVGCGIGLDPSEAAFEP